MHDRRMTGKDVKKIRESNGFTVTRLAEEIGVHHSTVSRWESGISPISALAEKALRQLEKKNGRKR